jgi:hypothetical protein
LSEGSVNAIENCKNLNSNQSSDTQPVSS